MLILKKLFYSLYAVFFNVCRIFPIKKNRVAFVAPHNGGEKDSLGVMRSYIEKIGGYDIVIEAPFERRICENERIFISVRILIG